MRDYEYLDIERQDGIVTVWLDRAPVNAVNQAMYREIDHVFRSFRASAGDKVVVLASRHRHFCAGNDIGEFSTLAPDNSDARMAEVRSAFFAIQDCAIPVIGAVHGAALGTGLAIAASCDFVIAASDATFGTPEVGVGVMGGARHLGRLVPEPWVRWMYMTTRPLSAAELYRLGGIIEVVEREDLVAASHRHAALISGHSKPILMTAKAALNVVEEMPLQPGYTYEQTQTTAICGHPDSIEAVRSVVERRPAAYPSELPA